MMFTYDQASGVLTFADGRTAKGWAGNNEIGPDMNNPDAQFVKDHGPLCQGFYTIQGPFDDPHLGKLAFKLIPDADDDLEGRGGFCIHGAEFAHPELSSDGCMIMDHPTRQAIADSGDTRLQVVA
jgi:hypothetical protein